VIHVISGNGSTVAITDPTVPNGGSAQLGTAFPQHGLDLPDIPFGAQLLGDYMAGSFVTTADGHGGRLLTQAPQTGQQPLLAHPVR
jgi:hypothetical protein